MTETKLRVHPTRKKPRDKYTLKPKTRALLDAGDIQGVIDRLTVRQRRFVEEYLVDFDGGAAVLRAGYNTSGGNATRLAHEMLQHPAIRAAIDQLTLERSKDLTLKPDYVIQKLYRTVEKAEKEGNHTAVLRGCEILARALGMFIERKEISGINGEAIKYEEVRKAADSFTSAISSLIERNREGPTPFEITPRDEG
jgi:hypothetical protein